MSPWRLQTSVTCDEKTYLLTENQSTYIPVGSSHRLENPGTIPLGLIEVQSGSYLGEDDIVRFEDRYNRGATEVSGRWQLNQPAPRRSP